MPIVSSSLTVKATLSGQTGTNIGAAGGGGYYYTNGGGNSNYPILRYPLTGGNNNGSWTTATDHRGLSYYNGYLYYRNYNSNGIYRAPVSNPASKSLVFNSVNFPNSQTCPVIDPEDGNSVWYYDGSKAVQKNSSNGIIKQFPITSSGYVIAVSRNYVFGISGSTVYIYTKDGAFVTSKALPRSMNGSYGFGCNPETGDIIYSSGSSQFTVVNLFSDIVNEPPSLPGAFVQQPEINSVNLSGEEVDLQWGVSSDSEGDNIKYILEFYNGSSWNAIASNLSITSYKYKIPSLSITNAQFRVKAVDDKGGESSYRVSNAFTIRKQLLLIQDGDIIKTFKNGSWQSL